MNGNEVHENRDDTDNPVGLDNLGRLPEHVPRPDWAELAPEAFKAMVRVDTATKRGLDPVLLNLVKIRASRINHCALCLDMHSRDALAAGESAGRILQLGAWRESRHFYTAGEVAAIELTEAIAVFTDSPVPDEVYARAAAEFSESELARLVVAITMLSGWNGFGVSTCLVPGHCASAT
ncbi:carboxymuconolactone decarboxylase family protein [Streptomyces sp. NPDC002769]|uniref:carboxymuconolactone decarboxylase family protein n=1 Tax=Streptomyces sp. NPDC002769 TaxID=3154542 RepID=UPI00332B10E7